jgi:hypothetical protein
LPGSEGKAFQRQPLVVRGIRIDVNERRCLSVAMSGQPPIFPRVPPPGGNPTPHLKFGLLPLMPPSPRRGVCVASGQLSRGEIPKGLMGNSCTCSHGEWLVSGLPPELSIAPQRRDRGLEILPHLREACSPFWLGPPFFFIASPPFSRQNRQRSPQTHLRWGAPHGVGEQDILSASGRLLCGLNGCIPL